MSRLSVPAVTSFFDDFANASLMPSTTFPFLERVDDATEALDAEPAELAAPPALVAADAADADDADAAAAPDA